MPFSWAEVLTSLLAGKPLMLHAPPAAVILVQLSTRIVHGPAILVLLFHRGSAEQSLSGVALDPAGYAVAPIARTSVARDVASIVNREER